MLSQTYIPLIQKSIIKRKRLNTETVNKILQWCESAFVPSSNINNIVRKWDKKEMQWIYHVKHWKQDTYDHLFHQLEMEVPLIQGISKTTFVRLIKEHYWFVHMRKMYSGLCPHHDIGKYYADLLKQFRNTWHINCICSCVFCTLCEHGHNSSPLANCHDGTCTQCQQDSCSVEFTTAYRHTWKDKNYEKVNNRTQAVFSEDSGTRKYLMERITYEVQHYAAHVQQVNWFKTQFRRLKLQLQTNAIIIRWDYVENYVHEQNYSVSSQHFGKKQSTLLVATVWFWEYNYNDTEEVMETEIVKRWFDFTSEYLNHNSLFYEKSFAILLEELNTVISYEFNIVYNVSDGGNHFISRYAFWFIGKMAYKKGINV